MIKKNNLHKFVGWYSFLKFIFIRVQMSWLYGCKLLTLHFYNYPRLALDDLNNIKKKKKRRGDSEK